MDATINKKNKLEKPVIIMQPGPFHLFWTTGSFFFWELKSNFNFVFLVSENYRQSDNFQKLARLPCVLHVEYEASLGLLARHRFYKIKYDELLTAYQPRYVFLYNQSFPDNLYLTFLSKKIVSSAKRYSFQLGWMPRRWRENFTLVKNERIVRLSNRFPVLKSFPKLVEFAVELLNRSLYILNYKLVPGLVAGVFFNPPLNVFNGKVNADAIALSTDPHLVYLEKEKMMFDEQGMSNLQLIRHPLSTVGDSLFHFLYGDFQVQDIILILPTYGFTSTLLLQGNTENEIITNISLQLRKALEVLQLKFPAYGIKIKLHPVALTSDNMWSEIIKLLSRYFDSLTVIPPQESAEWHISQSKVIVGDTSSTLWWAAMYGSKKVISLDIFGYPAGDDMKDFDGIHYVTSPNNIVKECDSSISEKYCSQQSLTDVINQELKLFK
jgi:hypothetical protein